jgi:hypothetical protein
VVAFRGAETAVVALRRCGDDGRVVGRTPLGTCLRGGLCPPRPPAPGPPPRFARRHSARSPGSLPLRGSLPCSVAAGVRQMPDVGPVGTALPGVVPGAAACSGAWAWRGATGASGRWRRAGCRVGVLRPRPWWRGGVRRRRPGGGEDAPWHLFAGGPLPPSTPRSRSSTSLREAPLRSVARVPPAARVPPVLGRCGRPASAGCRTGRDRTSWGGAGCRRVQQGPGVARRDRSFGSVETGWLPGRCA